MTIEKNKQIFEKYEKIINKNELNKDFIFTILCLFFIATFMFNINHFAEINNPEEINNLLNSLDKNKFSYFFIKTMYDLGKFVEYMLKIFSIITYGYMLKIIFEVLSNDGFYFKDNYLKNFFKEHKNEKDYGLKEMEKLLKDFEIEKENYIKTVKPKNEKDLKMIDFMMHLKFIETLSQKQNQIQK